MSNELNDGSVENLTEEQIADHKARVEATDEIYKNIWDLAPRVLKRKYLAEKKEKFADKLYKSIKDKNKK